MSYYLLIYHNYGTPNRFYTVILNFLIPITVRKNLQVLTGLQPLASLVVLTGFLILIKFL